MRPLAHIENGQPLAGHDLPEAPVYVQQAPAAAAGPLNSYRQYLQWEQQQ